MAKTQNKTQKTSASVENFIGAISDEGRRKDCFTVARLMKQVTKEEPKMWGTAIVGFGEYHYKYESGREGDCCVIGFSPRKQNLTLYFMGGCGSFPEELKKLGKHKTGKGCLYINKLEEIDLSVLKDILEKSVAMMKQKKTGKV